MRRIAILAAVGVIILAALFIYRSRERPYDRSFDASIAAPAYPDSGPLVLYDEGHRNTHLTTTGYKPLADLIRNDGYTLRTSNGTLTAEQLREVQILILVLAQGNPTNDSAAYTDAEAAAVGAWVRGGGSLLLITDHWPFGLSMRRLATHVDIDLGAGFVEDPTYHDPERGESHLVFSRENGLLNEHPITRGVERVLSFTGSSVASARASSFMVLSDSATERPPGPAREERSGGDVRVLMEYGDPRPARGRAQGLALELGRGRVVVLGDAGMLRAQRDRGGRLVGMNVPGYDNRQLALNIVHWLSRLM